MARCSINAKVHWNCSGGFLTKTLDARDHPIIVNLNSVGEESNAERNSPAHQGGNDDAPGCAAAVGVGLFTALLATATEPERVEEEEEEVQGQAG